MLDKYFPTVKLSKTNIFTDTPASSFPIQLNYSSESLKIEFYNRTENFLLFLQTTNRSTRPRFHHPHAYFRLCNFVFLNK